MLPLLPPMPVPEGGTPVEEEEMESSLSLEAPDMMRCPKYLLREGEEEEVKRGAKAKHRV